MRILLCLLGLLSWASLARAQHTELSGRAGLNLSHFVGSSAQPESAINYYSSNGAMRGYTNNPYGGRLGLGAGLGARLVHESRFPLLLALDLGYDYQRARTTITSLNFADRLVYVDYAADGHSYLTSQHVTLFLALGYRLRLGATRLDVLAGPEVAAVFGQRDTGQGTYNGTQPWRINESRSVGLPIDGLLRADLTVWRGRWGLNSSYAWGGGNYTVGLVGARSPAAFERSLRLGLVYRLRPGATP